MEKNKIYMLMLFMLILTVSSIIVFSDFGSDPDAFGCCINPKAPSVPCNSDLEPISLKNVCCRDPAIYTSYYYSAEQPWGPSNYDICKNNYFVVNTDCSGVSNCTISGCCCITTGDGWETRKKFECYGNDVVEWKAGTSSECPSLCETPECTTAQQCRDNEPYCSVQDCCGVESLNPGVCDPMENAENCPADCGAACTPTLSSLQINPIKGEKKLELSWSDGCSGLANYYVIERCPGSGCTNFQQIAQSATRYFIDSSNELLWNADYRYRITASYNTLSAMPFIEGSKTTGNLECWYQYSSNFFCINAPYYYSYQDYMSANSISPNGNYYNKAYYCDTGNLLRSQGTDCGTQNVCIVESNTPQCLASADCKIETTPLGLYGTKPSCETGNYCFFDKSYSLVDTCYSCKTDMSCYDYKSQSACTTDNCAVGSCEWSSTIQSIGIGVCASTIKSNCEWCNKKGSDSLKNENWGAYNNIFDTCTQQKSDALEVPGYKCYYSDGASKSCRDVVCTNYKESTCGAGVRSHNEYNIINPGKDPCGINVCQWFLDYAGCYKNADGNTERDCISDSSCEADYFMPNATLYPQINKGIYEKLSIDIWDRTSVSQEAAKITNPDYKTYLCIYPSPQEGSTACRSAGHPFVQYTNKLNLIVSNLNLFEEGNRNNNWSLAEWGNIIRYYSQDPSKNIGLVNELAIEAHDDTTGPIIESINVSGSTKINNIYYTNIEKPTITVRFYEPAITVYQKITGASGAVQTPAISPANANSQEYSTIEFTPAANLGEGAYTFEFDAKNTNNIFLGNHSIKFVIDRQTATVNITPANGAILNRSLVDIIFKFNKNVTLTSVMLNQIDIKSNFSSDYNKEFRTALALSDGPKSLIINAKDYAGNIISGTSVFSVNALPPEINLTEPTYGVSPTYMFNITVTTMDDVPCRYYFSIGGSPPPTLPASYNDWSAFSSEQGTKHKITGFSGIPVGDIAVHKFYVACNDPLWGVHSEVFDLSVDTTPPVILEAFADDIIQLPLNTTIYVQTDEDTMCRYDDNNVNYGNMRYLFPADLIPYRITHRQSKSVSSEGQYTVYVACENKAGLISSIQQVSFKVDLTVPLILTDYTEPYSNETRITLSVGTNKDAYCYYGTSQNSISNWLGTSEKTRSHNQQLTNLAIGPHTYYARCNTGSGGEEKNIIITVSIDTTAPNMVYVNDTSTIADKPEYTWMTDKLRVKFLARDNETSVSYYQYLLEEFYSPYNRMVNWTATTTEDSWFWVQGLNLSDDSKYNFRVKAKNIVGLASGEMKSDGITINTALLDPICSNYQKDGAETDIDCGGSCELCINGKSCLTNSDCSSGYCNSSRICAAPSCSDNNKNQDETDIDCGGSCSPCSNNKVCIENSDCLTNYCSYGKCKDTDACSDNKISSGETDIDCGGICPKGCSEGKSCDINSDCASTLECVSSICKLPVEEADTDGDGMPDDWETKNNLDPTNPDDAKKDSDEDILTNLEEYKYNTDPNSQDSDGDGFTDKEEIDAGTDPLDPNSYPKQKGGLSIFLLVLGILVLLSGSGYLAYTYYYKPKKEKIIPRMPVPPKLAIKAPPPIRLAAPPEEKLKLEAIEKKKSEREEGKRKERESLFSQFAPEKKEEIKEATPEKTIKEKQEKTEKPEKAEKQEKTKQKKAAQKRETAMPAKLKEGAKGRDVFRELSAIAKGREANKKTKEDAFKKLSALSKKGVKK